jgi:peptide/nickel transport system substrate-binding protein
MSKPFFGDRDYRSRRLVLDARSAAALLRRASSSSTTRHRPGSGLSAKAMQGDGSMLPLAPEGLRRSLDPSLPRSWSKRLTRATAVASLAMGLSVAAGPTLAADAGKPVPGGSAILAMDPAGLANLNSQLTSLTPTLMMADLWADGLMARDRDGGFIPHIATSWTISDDRKTYTFNLRRDLKWSDDKPFSSADVAFTLTQVAKYNTYQTKFLPLVESVETPDDATFIVHLKQPVAAALDLLDKDNFPLVAKHIYEGTDIPTNPANRKPVGLGPFKFQSWEEGRALTFVRNPNYWDQPKPYLDSVVVALIPNPQQLINALLQGEVDWSRLDYTQVQRAQDASKSGKLKVVKIETFAPERATVDFNMRRKPFDNVEVRRALFQAIDRKRISADAYRGLAVPAMSAIPEQFKPLFDPSINYEEMYPFDPKKAGSMLDAAGFPLKDGKRFSLELTYIATSPYDADAKSVGAQWSAIGIDVKLAGLDSQIWTDKVYVKNDFDVSLISLTARSDPTLGVDRSFVCNAAHLPYVNPTGYCNPELDRLALQAGSVSTEQRRVLYKQYAEIVARDLNELTLTNAPTFHAVATKFQNLDALFNVAFNEAPSWADVWLPENAR